MKLTLRDNGVYMLDYYDGPKRYRVSTGERDKARAEVKAREIIASSVGRAGEAWTLKDALQDCYDRIWSHQKSCAPHLLRINKLIRARGPTPIELISYNWLVEFREWMEREWGCKVATANRHMSAISKALSEASLRGKLKARPRIPYKREPKGKLRWLTAAEESLLLDSCGVIWAQDDANAMRALLVFLLDTGARLSEALKVGAEFRHVWPNASTQATFADTKNGSSRSVPLTPRAKEALIAMPPWTAKLAVDRFTRLRNHCALPDVSLHTMRHTCASRLVQGGMDLYRVMAWLGHSEIKTTQRYAHLASTSLSEGADILSNRAHSEPNQAHSGDWIPTGGHPARPVSRVPALKIVK